MNYSLEYFFIPLVVDKSNEDEFAEDGVIIFDSLDSFQIGFGVDFPEQSRMFDWEHFCITKKMTTHYEYWFFEFPTPIEEPEALWGIVVHHEFGPYLYYTFEKAVSGDYVLGSMSGESVHKEYGFYSEDTPAEVFIQKALELADEEDFPDDEE